MRSELRRWSLLRAGLLLLGLASPLAANASVKTWLGVVTQEVTSELRDALDLTGNGVLVNRVVADSPADRAGVRKGDVITAFNRRAISSPASLSDAVQEEAVGATATVKLLRRGVTQTVTVKLGSRPDRLEDEATPAPGSPHIRVWKDGREVEPKDVEDEIPGLEGLRHLDGLGAMPRMMWMDGSGWGRGRLGVRIQELNPDLAGYFTGSNGTGALVLEVVEDSPASRAGVKAGDVIVRVGTLDVKDPEDLVKAIEDEEGAVTLTVVRKGVRRTLEATLEERARDRRTFRFENRAPRSPGMAPRSSEDDDLRQQMEELRQQLRELRKQMEDRER